MKRAFRFVALILALVLCAASLCACGAPEIPEWRRVEPVTEKAEETSIALTTKAPETEAATTKAPGTEAPTSKTPETEATTTEVPTAEAATTEASTTEAQTVEIAIIELLPTTAPTTEAPTTKAPTTAAPTTKAPTTEAPTTKAPTTEAPTTKAPTTEAPTTEEPTTEEPMTEEPTTEEPMTEEPTTEEPMTEEPTTEELITEEPETEAPTTTAPDNVVPEGFKEHKHRWLSMVIPEDYIEATVSGVRMLVPSGFPHPDDSIAFTESEAYVEAATESAVKDYFESTYLDKYGIEISNFTYKRTVIPGADMIITSFTFLDKGVDYIQTACFVYNDNDLIAVMFTDTSRIYTEAFKTSINSIHVSE